MGEIESSCVAFLESRKSKFLPKQICDPLQVKRDIKDLIKNGYKINLDVASTPQDDRDNAVKIRLETLKRKSKQLTQRIKVLQSQCRFTGFVSVKLHAVKSEMSELQKLLVK